MIQQIITYIIVTAAVSYVLFKFVNIFFKKSKKSSNSVCTGCSASGCNGCALKNINFTPKRIVK